MPASAEWCCARCGGDVVPVAYGYPGPDLRAAEERGEVLLGGCMPGGPRFACRACRSSAGFGDEPPPVVRRENHSPRPACSVCEEVFGSDEPVLLDRDDAKRRRYRHRKACQPPPKPQRKPQLSSPTSGSRGGKSHIEGQVWTAPVDSDLHSQITKILGGPEPYN